MKNLFQLRFQSATERLETPSEIRKSRREIARIKTIMRERELRDTRPKPTPRRAGPSERRRMAEQPRNRGSDARSTSASSPATR